MTTGIYAPPPKKMEITLPSGTVIPILAWARLGTTKDDYGNIVTLYTPVLPLEYMKGNIISKTIGQNVLSAQYTNEQTPSFFYDSIVQVPLEGLPEGVDPEFASGASKNNLKLNPQDIDKIAILSSLEGTALSQGIVSPADIDTNEGLRTVIGDMVKQWGQGSVVNPLPQLAAIKTYMPELPAGTDLNLPENARLKQSRIAMARDIANTLTAAPDKLQDVVKQWNTRMTPQPTIPTPSLVPRPQTQVNPQQLEADVQQTAKASQPFTPVEPRLGGMPITANDLQSADAAAAAGQSGDVAGAIGATTGLFEKKKAFYEKQKVVWQNLVEQARNEIQKAQRQVKF